jgi:hypothetical protein
VIGKAWASTSETVGGAEIALEEAADVEQILHDERLVEVVLLSHLLDHARSGRAIAVQGGDGIAGQREDHEVDQEGRAEEDGDELQEAFAGVPEHQRPPAEVSEIITFNSCSFIMMSGAVSRPGHHVSGFDY